MPCCEVGNVDLFVKICKQIIKMQEEVNCDESCITCDSSLGGSQNDTKPVSFFMCDGSIFKCPLTAGEDPTISAFRVEEIINCKYVKLRLLDFNSETDQSVTCTKQTCILNLDCVCAIECFEAIRCCEESCAS